MTWIRYGVWFAALALLLSVGGAEESPRAKPAESPPEAPAKPGPPKREPRRVYVLHSGVHTILANANKNIFAETMRETLKKRGIAENDIVVLDNPYPTAHWYNMFPHECLTLFMASAKADSKVVLDAYARMDKALKQKDVTADDELVLIGHSAGGQMCLSLAFLAGNHAGCANLAKTTDPYHVHMVVTLGAPVAHNPLADDVQVRHYLSPRDPVPRRMTRLSPPVLWVMRYDKSINIVPTKLSPACKVRMFLDIEHPNWDTEERVADRILAESKTCHRPAWQVGMCYPWLRLAPIQLACQALDELCHIAIEDPPRFRK